MLRTNQFLSTAETLSRHFHILFLILALPNPTSLIAFEEHETREFKKITRPISKKETFRGVLKWREEDGNQKSLVLSVNLSGSASIDYYVLVQNINEENQLTDLVEKEVEAVGVIRQGQNGKELKLESVNLVVQENSRSNTTVRKELAMVEEKQQTPETPVKNPPLHPNSSVAFWMAAKGVKPHTQIVKEYQQKVRETFRANSAEAFWSDAKIEYQERLRNEDRRRLRWRWLFGK